MHRVVKIKFMLFYGEAPEAKCYGYMELNQDGNMIALYNRYGEEIDMYGQHEFVKIRTLGKFDNEDRDNFYSLLESDGVG
ncbi:hypothetical protein ACYCSE_08915 [Paenibacillus sp. SEL1]|uniref:hypothetical protein n=1 Tax=Paenibacillus TaxID=44249 RepID=UPI0020B7DF96|nr:MULTISPECIES: hypothetical protein [Paenibacillus]MCP3806624.1 hypothetical protein [Paenibacillus sp. Lou8.1]MDY7990302.1 hypothetical protein [Paenibacillus polymyxa]MDY8117158.1 hypothetical protein [Paenibacillus polymyxa]